MPAYREETRRNGLNEYSHHGSKIQFWLQYRRRLAWLVLLRVTVPFNMREPKVGEPDLSDVRVLGLDGFAIQKGHRYADHYNRVRLCRLGITNVATIRSRVCSPPTLRRAWLGTAIGYSFGSVVGAPQCEAAPPRDGGAAGLRG
jgi:hypothetical protein